eukprot:6214680-Lingulodinium_polyedra.AAC.1
MIPFTPRWQPASHRRPHSARAAPGIARVSPEQRPRSARQHTTSLCAAPAQRPAHATLGSPSAP